MLNDIFNPAVQDIAQPIQRVGFHILIVLQTIDERAIDVVVGIQVVLCHAPVFHGLPQLVVGNHAHAPKDIPT